MRKIAARGIAVLLLLSAFILVPCMEPVRAQTDEEPLAEEEMPFEEFDEGFESLDMEEEEPVEEEGMEDMPEPEVLSEEDPFAEAEPMAEAKEDEVAEADEGDWDVAEEEAADEDPFAEAEPIEEMAEEPEMAEPASADKPAPAGKPAAMAEEDFDIESAVDEIESIETEEVVFDHSSEVIALALKLNAAEEEIERLRSGVFESDDSLVDELREELKSTQDELEELEKAVSVGKASVKQAGKMASLESKLKQSEKEKRALRAKIDLAAAQLRAAKARTGGEKSGDLEKAEKEIERLRDLVKRIWQANRREKLNMHYNMAAAYRAGDMMEKAESHYVQALKIDPEDAGVHYNLAILYDDEIKNKKKAREHYEKFLELAPDDKDAAQVVQWLATMD